MATDFFNNLKTKKKKAIIDSIETCLKIMSYDSISVEDILKSAEISRGTFYKYFTDKNDAIATFFDERMKYLLDVFKICIMECNYKLFDGVVEAYNCLKYMLKDSVYIVFKNSFNYFIGLFTNALYSNKYDKEINDLLNWLVENTIEGKETLKTPEIMKDALELIFAVFMSTILKMAMFPSEEIDNIDFSRKIAALKKGILESATNL